MRLQTHFCDSWRRMWLKHFRTYDGHRIGKRNMQIYHGLHLSTCTNEPFGEDLCARCEVVIKREPDLCTFWDDWTFCEWRATLVCGAVRLLLVTRVRVTYFQTNCLQPVCCDSLCVLVSRLTPRVISGTVTDCHRVYCSKFVRL